MQTRPQFAGLTTPSDIAAREEAHNRRADEAVRRSSVRALTLRMAMGDVRDALMGWDLLERDRLRGIGLLLIATGLVYMVLY